MRHEEPASARVILRKSHRYLFVPVAGKEPEARDLDETSLLFLRTRERLRGQNDEGGLVCAMSS